MKKFAFILAILIIFTSIPFSVNAEDVYKETLRVGLTYASKTEEWFYSESSIDIIDGNYMAYITTIPAKTKFRVYTYGGLLASDYFAPTTGVILFESASEISVNNSPYRGKFELRNYNDKITVINIVNTEEYLYSVLGREMSSSWPIEALKTQAVCARNYALTIGGKHSQYGFDICDDTHCQVYSGMSSEADSTIQAVEATRGVLVTYQGKVVSLYYYSCNGGYSESSENVWVSPLGYLRGKKDEYEGQGIEISSYWEKANWSVTFTKEEIETILNNKGMGVGEIVDIRIDKVSENNGVTELTFVGTMGEKTVKKSSARTTLSLNSQAFTIQKHATGQVPTKEVPNTNTWTVWTADGIEEVVNPKYVLTANGIEEIDHGTVQVPVDDNTSYAAYTFSGHGWGHLVGMSQWGAYSMARMGFTYQDILNYYYTDIEIQYNQYIEDEPIVEDNISIEIDGEIYIEEELYYEDEFGEIKRNDTGI